MISLRNVRKDYQLDNQRIEVLKNINLDLDLGQLTCLLGESGCGKSTLLNIIGGIDSFTEGTYIFDKKDVRHFKEKEWSYFRRKKIGFVFQNFNLISHLSALENIEMSLILEGKSKKDRRKRALELLSIVGMNNRANHLPNQLSGGQKQRIAIARALANDPDIILADEPTGALDSDNSVQIMELLKEIARKGKIVLVVTHSRELIQYADRVIEMRDGEIVNSNNQDSLKEYMQEHSNQKKKNKFPKGKRINWSTTLKLAFRNIRNKKWRNILTAVGASIGIFGIAIIGALGNGINEKISTTVDDNIANASVDAAKGSGELLVNKDYTTLKNLENAKEIYPYNAYSASIRTKDDKKTSVSAESLVPDKYKSIYGKKYIKNGYYPATNKNEIVIPERTAIELFGTAKKAIGEEVAVTAQLMSLDDMYPTEQIEVKISGVLRNESIPLLDTTGLSYSVSEQLMNGIEETKGKSLAYTIIPTSTNKMNDLKKAIESEGFNAQTEGESSSELQNYVTLASVALGLLSAISLVVSSLMIGIVLYVSVVERTREIGILKAIGAFRSDIKRIFVTEGLVIGLLGGIIGTIGAFGVGKIANIIMEDFMNKQNLQLFQYDWTQLLVIILFSSLLGVTASFIPASKASKQTALEALRYE
ncbi:ATP-binding cassette domain-containing protein [Niallia sp. NCCP-28]|uniref:ABC transporter ATP-binding protein/permease n=1 Tax=Niallia sp. NCCP-28 TaxID=2934712 RepID=UPI0020824ACF|nr:ABC transporter ATP-binding protein/permease [Niallia sp. NCCP-28]GKU84909.1 ABC transporter ATP-binding protein [Niallia sp. NCCP-28]